jgi:hypothetical protein
MDNLINNKEQIIKILEKLITIENNFTEIYKILNNLIKDDNKISYFNQIQNENDLKEYFSKNSLGC